MSEPDDLARTQELFEFLQGRVPGGYKVRPEDVPNLTADQAWTVIWYLGSLYWQVTDHIERCDVCGTLHDTWSEGTCLDYGDKPYFFCDSCVCGPEYEAKLAQRSE